MRQGAGNTPRDFRDTISRPDGTRDRPKGDIFAGALIRAECPGGYVMAIFFPAMSKIPLRRFAISISVPRSESIDLRVLAYFIHKARASWAYLLQGRT